MVACDLVAHVGVVVCKAADGEPAHVALAGERRALAFVEVMENEGARPTRHILVAEGAFVRLLRRTNEEFVEVFRRHDDHLAELAEVITNPILNKRLLTRGTLHTGLEAGMEFVVVFLVVDCDHAV